MRTRMKFHSAAVVLLGIFQASVAYGQNSNGCIAPPVSCRVTSAFGYRVDPFNKSITGKKHQGVDFGCPMNTPVNSADGGTVLFASTSVSAGNLVIVKQGERTFKYMHNERLFVKLGQVLTRSQLVANSGNSGRSTGPHLHFEVHVSDSPTDPYAMLCSKPALKDGVLQGETPDIHDMNPELTAESHDNSPSPFEALGLEGSFREILQDVISSRTFNPDYQRQLMEFPEVKLYSELSFINTLRLRIKHEVAGQKERTIATMAMLQALKAEKAMKPQIEAQRTVATRAKN